MGYSPAALAELDKIQLITQNQGGGRSVPLIPALKESPEKAMLSPTLNLSTFQKQILKTQQDMLTAIVGGFSSFSVAQEKISRLLDKPATNDFQDLILKKMDQLIEGLNNLKSFVASSAVMAAVPAGVAKTIPNVRSFFSMTEASLINKINEAYSFIARSTLNKSAELDDKKSANSKKTLADKTIGLSVDVFNKISASARVTRKMFNRIKYLSRFRVGDMVGQIISGLAIHLAEIKPLPDGTLSTIQTIRQFMVDDIFVIFRNLFKAYLIFFRIRKHKSLNFISTILGGIVTLILKLVELRRALQKEGVTSRDIEKIVEIFYPVFKTLTRSVKMISGVSIFFPFFKIGLSMLKTLVNYFQNFRYNIWVTAAKNIRTFSLALMFLAAAILANLVIFKYFSAKDINEFLTAVERIFSSLSSMANSKASILKIVFLMVFLVQAFRKLSDLMIQLVRIPRMDKRIETVTEILDMAKALMELKYLKARMSIRILKLLFETFEYYAKIIHDVTEKYQFAEKLDNIFDAIRKVMRYFGDIENRANIMNFVNLLGQFGAALWKFYFRLVKIGITGNLSRVGLNIVAGAFNKIFRIVRQLVKHKPDVEIAKSVIEKLSYSMLAFIIAISDLQILLSIPLYIALTMAIVVISGLSRVMRYIGQHHSDINKGSSALALMSGAVFVMSFGLMALTFVFAAMMLIGFRKLADLLIMTSMLMMSMVMLGTAFFLIGKKSKDIFFGSLVVGVMALGVAVFSLGLLMMVKTLSSLDIATTIPLILFGIGVMALTGLVMAGIGMFAGNILLGALSVAVMGLSLIPFGIGMRVLSEGMKGWDWTMALVTLAMVAGLSIILGVLGTVVASTFGAPLLGPLMLAAIGFSLIPLGLGLLTIKNSMKEMTFGDVMTFLTLITGVSLVIGLLGLAVAATFGTAFLGPVMIAAIGLSLIPFSLGMRSILTVRDLTLMDVAKYIGFITAVSAVYTAAGVLSPILFAGVVILSMMGQSLKIITEGLLASQKVDWAKYPVERISEVLIGLGKAFAALGSENAGGGFLGGVLNILGIGPNLIKKGIESIFSASRALVSVSEGVQMFYSKIQSFGPDAFKVIGKDANGNYIYDPASLPFKINLLLGVINEAFARIGASGNQSNSLLSQVFGTDFKKSDTEVGINSVMNTGKALKSITEGLVDFHNRLRALGPDAFDEKSPNSIRNRVATVVGVINSAFSLIGKSGNSNMSILGALFGTDFSMTDTEVGIDSVMNTGKALRSVVDGILAFQTLVDKNIDLSNGENSIQKKIASVVTLVAQAFAGVGKGNVFGSIFGMDDVSAGVRSVTNMGANLKDIALGLREYGDLQKNFPGLDLNKAGGSQVIKNIAQVITLLGQAFAGIGKTGQAAGFKIFGITVTESYAETDVQKGIKSIQGLGAELKGVAESLKVFADLKKLGLGGDAFDINKSGSVANNIYNVLTAIGRIFSEIGSKGKWETNSRGEKVWIYDESISKGIKSVQGIGGELENIAKSIKVFSDINQTTKGLNISQISNNIREVMTVVSNVFSEIGSKSVSADGKVLASEQVAKGIEAMKGSGEVLDSLSKSLAPYMDLQTKRISVEVLKRNITDLTKLTIDVISAVGSEDTNFVQSVLNKQSRAYSMEEIQEGKRRIIEGQEGIKLVLDISNSLKGLDSTDISNKSKFLEELAVAPISALTKSAELSKTMGPVLDRFIDQVFPRVRNEIYKLIELQIKVSQDTAKNQNAIPLLVENYGKFISLIKMDINKTNMDRFSAIVGFIEKYSKLADPFRRFAMEFAKHVKDVKDLVSSINNINLEKFKEYTGLQYRLTEFVKADSSKMRENLDTISGYLIQVQSAMTPKIIINQPTASPTNNTVINNTHERVERERNDEMMQEVLNRLDRVAAILDGISNGTRTLKVKEI